MALVNGCFLHYRGMKKFLNNLLLRNCGSDFEIISQECSLGDLFQKCSRNFDTSINMSLVNGGFSHYRDMKKFLKNLLLRNCGSYFEMISKEYSLSDPFQNLFAKFWSVFKYGSGEWGLFALYGHEEILKKNCFLQNRLSDFEIISQECSLGDPFQKLSAKFWSVYKYGLRKWGLFALYRHEEILKKSCSQKPLVRFWNNFTGIRFWH